MYYDTYLEARHQEMTEFYEKEMHRIKSESLKTLSLPAHFKKQELIARIIANSYFQEYEDAVNLAYSLDLGKVHFFAILEQFDEFKIEYSRDLELAQNF